MLGAIIDKLRGRPEPSPSDALPAELVAAIQVAGVFYRHEGDEPAPVVRCAALGGMFAHTGINDTAARVERYFPGLSKRAYRKAAHLVAGRCADLNATAHRPGSMRDRAGSWTMDPARW